MRQDDPDTRAACGVIFERAGRHLAACAIAAARTRGYGSSTRIGHDGVTPLAGSRTTSTEQAAWLTTLAAVVPRSRSTPE